MSIFRRAVRPLGERVNRAVAVAMASGPADGLALVDAIGARDDLAGSHLLPSVRGELLVRLGRDDEARVELPRAIDLCGNAVERAALEAKVAGLSPR